MTSVSLKCPNEKVAPGQMYQTIEHDLKYFIITKKKGAKIHFHKKKLV